MDKLFAGPLQPRIHAVFNKMPVFAAKNIPNKINHLAASKFGAAVPMRHIPTNFYNRG